MKGRVGGALEGLVNQNKKVEALEKFFLLQRCLGKSRAVRPSVSKAKETTGMYNRPLNTFQSKLSNKLISQRRRISRKEGLMKN